MTAKTSLKTHYCIAVPKIGLVALCGSIIPSDDSVNLKTDEAADVVDCPICRTVILSIRLTITTALVK